MMDAGTVTLCELVNTAPPGAMPVEVLSPLDSMYYEDRFIGYGRFYAAKGVNEQVDLIVRTWRWKAAKIGLYAVLSDSDNDGQYRITNVQNLLDDDGLQATDLTLTALENNYDLATET